jgi:isopenicillin N synthase-like dioxygenase
MNRLGSIHKGQRKRVKQPYGSGEPRYSMPFFIDHDGEQWTQPCEAAPRTLAEALTLSAQDYNCCRY